MSLVCCPLCNVAPYMGWGGAALAAALSYNTKARCTMAVSLSIRGHIVPPWLGIQSSRKSLCLPFDTSVEDDDLSVQEECIEPTPSLPSKIVDWTGCHSDDNKTARESALIVQSEIQDDSSSVTGNITVIKKRINGHREYVQL